MIKRTQAGYPVLVMPDDRIQLEAMFGLEHATEREQAALDDYCDPIAKAVFLFAVRCLAQLGYLPDLECVPPGILTYVGDQVEAVIPTRYLRDRPARRSEILTTVRAVLDYQRWTAEREGPLRELLLTLALDHPREADLVIAAVERLREWRVELPAEATLVTMVESVLQQVEDETYTEVLRRADPSLQATLHGLLEQPEHHETLLALIKRPAGKVGVRSMRREAEKLAALTEIGIPDDALRSISQRKLVFLAEQAKRYTAADLRALSDQRRTLILIAFVIRSRQEGRDTMLEQLDKLLRRLTRTSAETEQEAVLRREKQTPYPRKLATKILAIIALAPPGTVEEQLFALMPQADYRRIYTSVSGEDEQFAKHTTRATMLRRFRAHYRQVVTLILTHIPFQANAPEGRELMVYWRSSSSTRPSGRTPSRSQPAPGFSIRRGMRNPSHRRHQPSSPRSSRQPPRRSGSSATPWNCRRCARYRPRYAPAWCGWKALTAMPTWRRISSRGMPIHEFASMTNIAFRPRRRRSSPN